MSIIYEEHSLFHGRPPSPNADATKAWLRHYDNALLLRWLAQHKAATFTERRQAEKELEIAERKMRYWQRHPNYVPSEALAGAADLKMRWKETH
ncbi:hypothetical protein [Azospirillum argentinense]|uniref:hypothetical protein n=1 Tax=Azospirillum argentinense TaxID=2970906 RepID=UPI0032DF71B5